jgi:rhodanese-related sulfurtransferase
VKVFDLTVATTGWNERKLKAAGKSFQAIHTHPGSHAGYYPGSTSMHIKLIYDPQTLLILGAQAVGQEGVDKRVDVIATAMRAGMQVSELADLELCYAPPFGSAKDPINMLGYIADNMINGSSKTVQWYEIGELQTSGATVIDVRTKKEFDDGHIPNAVNIPVDELRDRLAEIPKSKLIINCQVGQRGHTASMLLNELGYQAANLDGGYITWSDAQTV